MRKIYFCNNGILSLMDLTTMGDSSKRNNSDTIGKFDSGLKYAIAILLRNSIAIRIETGDNIYEFDSEIMKDEETGKEKEMILVHQMNKNNNGKVIHRTAFALQLGHEWELWMAIRELYSNCLDEGGYAYFGEGITHETETIITLDENPKLEKIIDDWDSYFIGSRNLLLETSGVKVYPNTKDENFKVYKNGILIHRDESMKSLYCYDHHSADIDEMRILKNVGQVSTDIEYALCKAESPELIDELIRLTDTNVFEGTLSYTYSLSDMWCIIAQTIYNDKGSIDCTDNLLYTLRNDRRLDLGVAYVPTTRTQWSENKVMVTTPTVEEPIRLTFEEEAKLICKNNGFDVEFPIVMSEIKGITCLADMSKKCVYVTEDFSEIHVWEMIKAVFKLRHRDDPDAIFKEYALKIQR